MSIHFLLRESVKQFVRDLPQLIRNFKTSTTTKQSTNHGHIKGQINWKQTVNHPLRVESNDKTVFSVNERNREYAIKENLVLLEALETLHSILFHEVDSEHFEKYDWFKEWTSLKESLNQLLHKNIYLSRVRREKTSVTTRMIMDTLKHRHRLYRNAAHILLEYKRIQSGDMDQEELTQLLRETFVFPDEIDVLFELYWVVKLIENNSTNAQLQLMDGKNNLVAQWDDGKHLYKIYHDSGNTDHVKFCVRTAEVSQPDHPFITRQIQAMKEAETYAETLFDRGTDTSTYWRGRPDILIEVYDHSTHTLKKVVIGEIKHTSNTQYAITGLHELTEYMKLAKDQEGNYLEDHVKVKGMLFTDRIEGYGEREVGLEMDLDREGVVWLSL